MRSASEQHLYSRHQTTGRVGYLRSKYVETGRPEGLGVQPPILEVCLAAFAIAFDRLNHTRASRHPPRKNTRFSGSYSSCTWSNNMKIGWTSKMSILSYFLVIPKGFEPLTHRLEICCSIQLSYGTVPCKFGLRAVSQFASANIRFFLVYQIKNFWPTRKSCP